jgi:hypothetical protein
MNDSFLPFDRETTIGKFPLLCLAISGIVFKTKKEENIHRENEDHFCNRLSMATSLQSRKRETLEVVDGVKFCPLGHTIVSDATIQDIRLFLQYSFWGNSCGIKSNKSCSCNVVPEHPFLFCLP